MKNVALYARVSTEDQALKGFSLDGQLEKLHSYCDARDWDVAGEYVDNGYSGRDTNRPAYREMLRGIDAWDALLVMKMDRVHRNSKNFMVMMETLREHDKEFVSMTESLDTSTAMGALRDGYHPAYRAAGKRADRGACLFWHAAEGEGRRGIAGVAGAVWLRV